MVVLAAVLNGLKLMKRAHEDVKLVINGAGYGLINDLYIVLQDWLYVNYL